MYRKSFVRETISSLTEDRFEELKTVLNEGKYVLFDFITDADSINRQVFEEKLGDYFEKVELVAGGKGFDQIIDNYADDLDSVVKDNINKGSHSSKIEPRAKKYYDKAYVMKKEGLKSFDDFLDYSRIMLCLYMAIIKKKNGYISDFDYSSECLEDTAIIKALRDEKTTTIMGTRKRFNTKGEYNLDRCTFVMVIIMYQYIKSKEVGEDQ